VLGPMRPQEEAAHWTQASTRHSEVNKRKATA
jgi:hypothetical protein